MTTASRELFELCKQVYKATGLTGTNQVIGIYYQISEVDVKYGIFDRSEKRKEPIDTPLYTSDYLLEKLGDLDDEVHVTRCFHQDSSRNWCATYGSYIDGVHDIFSYEDTPLKALLKLTLKLHEEEV